MDASCCHEAKRESTNKPMQHQLLWAGTRLNQYKALSFLHTQHRRHVCWGSNTTAPSKPWQSAPLHNNNEELTAQ